MLSKLLAAATIVAGATFGGGAALAHFDLTAESASDTCTGQPEVVAQRNASDKDLRDAWRTGHKALESLRQGGKDVDHQALNDLVKSADQQLRDRLTTALNDVAGLTLGRDGLLSDSTDVADSSESSDTSEASDTQDENASDSNESDSGDHGRSCDIPAAAADQGALDDIVSAATDDMQKIVDDATKAAGDLEPAQHGNSGDHGPSGDHGKPDTAGQSGDHGPSGEHGKP